MARPRWVERRRWIIAVFGIREVGTLFYLSYALSKHDFEEADQLWAAVATTVLISITVHGLSAGPVMHHHDRRPGADHDPADGAAR